MALQVIEEYKTKLCSAENAVKSITSNQRIGMPLGGDAEALCQALASRKAELHNVELWMGGARKDYGFWEHDAQDAFRLIGDQTVGLLRGPISEQKADYCPSYYSLRFKEQDERNLNDPFFDVSFILISPPDKDGYCSFGHFMCNKKTYAQHSRRVIAQVDDRLIRTYGDNFIHISQVDAFVEENLPYLPWMPQTRTTTPPATSARRVSPEAIAVAHQIKPLLRNGDCIQIGAGSTAQFLFELGAFDGLSGLGCHTAASMAGQTRSVLDGQSNGQHKTVHGNVAISTTFSIDGGPDEVYKLHMNPKFALYSQAYVNDIRLIQKHDNMVSINNAIAVDITGQVASDGLGHEIWSGAGGQAEFSIGSALSNGGRNITVLPSTTIDKNGTRVSRIVPVFPTGTPVTVLRAFSDFVITENGIATLAGKTYKQRAAALISIAHQDFQSELKRDAQAILGQLS